MKSDRVSGYAARIRRVRDGLKSDGLDGILVTDLANIFYLSGFRGSDGAALLSQDELILMVDGRYGTQAKEVAHFDRLIVYPSKSEGILAEVGRLGWTRVGVEPRSMTLELYELLKKGLRKVSWKAVGEWGISLRAHKDPQEIETLKRANRIADESLLELIPRIRAGMEEREVGFELECIMRNRGADGCSFPMIVAGGENAAQPHAKTGHRNLKSGELFLIDYGCSLDGYQTDQTVTFSIGTPSSEMIRIYDAVREAHDRAIEAIRVGMPASQLDKVARGVLERQALMSTSHTVWGTGSEFRFMNSLKTSKTPPPPWKREWPLR